jgi:predicted anti-sigma-YlaC factor YlaD
MNCKEFQFWILRRDSGELSTWSAQRLSRHLVRCAVCREFDQALANAHRAVSLLPVPEVDRVTLAVLKDVATHHRRRHLRMTGRARVAWATAASLLIGAMIGALVLLAPSSDPEPNLADIGGAAWSAELLAMDALDVSMDLFAEELAALEAETEDTALAGGTDDAERIAQEILALWEV